MTLADPIRECARCYREYRQRGKEKRCPDCRFNADAKTSVCPYCTEVYLSHGETRAEIEERMNHAKGQCR